MGEPTDTAQQEIVRLEHEAHEAFLSADTNALARLLSDDYIFTDAQGQQVTKAEWLADMASGKLRFDSVESTALQVRTYGDAAVAIGRVAMKGLYNGEPFEGHHCYTATYVKLDGRWQLVAEQANQLPDS